MDRIRGVVLSDAFISEDGLYRYWLQRRSSNLGLVVFLMLNPSTADASVNDPTIRTCIDFAQRWGFGELVAVNVFAWRATDPLELRRAQSNGHDIVGPLNDVFTNYWFKAAKQIVCAWGANDLAVEPAKRLLALHPDLDFYCIDKTKTGAPAHPLYQKRDKKLVLYRAKKQQVVA